MLIEVFGVAFSLFALSRVVLRFREGRLSWGMMAVWSIAWISVIVFVLSPESLTPISHTIGIQAPLDLMLIVGLLMSYYLTFRVYIFLGELRSDLAKVVREIALLRQGKK